jgi:hypothetical protein
MDARQELALFPRFTTVVFSVEHRHLNTSDHQHVAGSEHARDWHGEDYLVLFDESEAAAVSERYEVLRLLPGFKVLGLRRWDDFIVRNAAGQTYSIPTLPLNTLYLSSFAVPDGKTALQPDGRFAGKIKWYVKPIALGGDAGVGENLVWVSHEERAQLVKWWNDKYLALKAPQVAGKRRR